MQLPAFALSPTNIFQNDLDFIERALAKQALSDDSFETLQAQDKFKIISLDPQHKINDIFNIPHYFYDSVHFWFNIYTLYNTSYVVIHDKVNLRLIYKVLDYSKLSGSILNNHTKVSLQSRFTLAKVLEIKKSLKRLANNKNIEADEKSIRQMLITSGLKIPSLKNKRKKFYNNLSSMIRAQTGQKNNISTGMINYLNYKKSALKFIHNMKIHKELLAIPFLESSYNVNAVSKVGAAGIWQFMPRIARSFMDQSKNTDVRLNPLIASVAAFHLLKQNKQILKRWDLGITAFNSGTRHIIKAQRKFKTKNLPLEEMLERYRHPHIGFAARNFYSEYLALVYTLAYQEELFSLDEINKQTLDLKTNDLSIYVTLCSFYPHRIYHALRKSSPDFKYLNRHLKYKKRRYPRGSLLVSDIQLTKKRYKKVSQKNIKSMYPKNWKKLIRNQSCSTK